MNDLLDDHIIDNHRPTRNWLVMLVWLTIPMSSVIAIVIVVFDINNLVDDLSFLIPYLEHDIIISVISSLVNTFCVIKARQTYLNPK